MEAIVPTTRFCHGDCECERPLAMFQGSQLRCRECNARERINLYYFVTNNELPHTSEEYEYITQENNQPVDRPAKHQFNVEAKYKCKGECGLRKNIVREFTHASRYPLGFYGVCRECKNPDRVIPSSSYDELPLQCDLETLKRLEHFTNKAYNPLRQPRFNDYDADCDRVTTYDVHVFDVISKSKGRIQKYDLYTDGVCKECLSPGLLVKLRGKLVRKRKGNMPCDTVHGQFEFECKHCYAMSDFPSDWLDKAFFNKYKNRVADNDMYNGYSYGWKRRVLMEEAQPLPPTIMQEDLPTPAPAIMFTDLLSSGHHVSSFRGGILITGKDGGSWFIACSKFIGLEVDPIEISGPQVT